MTKSVLICALLGVVGSFAVAQDTPPAPTAPFLAKLPAATCWRMDFVASSPSQPQAPLSAAETKATKAVKKQFLLTRSGDLRREQTIWNDGKTTDMWIVKGASFVKSRTSEHYAAFMPQNNPFGLDCPDFPELSWVDLNHFNKVEMKNGKRCFVYSTGDRKACYPYTLFPPPDSGVDSGSARVWVSVDTKLPVAWEEQGSTGIYTFGLPISVPELPAECQSVVTALDAYQKRVAGQKMVLPP